MAQIKPDDQRLKEDCARWLRDHVSDIDWAWANNSDPKNIFRQSAWHIQGARKLRRLNFLAKQQGLPPVKDVYVDVLGNPRPFKSFRTLPLYRIHAHLQRLGTVYYGSRRSTNHALLMLDFDWHGEAIEGHGEDTDAIQAARFIRDLFFDEKSVYIEPSTGGLGAHAFLLIDCVAISSSRLNEILGDATRRINHLLSFEGFECNFCGFYGTFTLVQDGWNIPKGGMSRLAKLPRPQTPAQMSQLMGLTIVQATRLSAWSHDIFFELLCEDYGLSIEDSKTSTVEVTADAAQAGWPTISVGVPFTTSITKQQDIQCGDNKSSAAGESERLAGLRGKHNPNERMFQAVFLLARRLNRPPIVQEAIDFYEANQLHTGADEGDRRRRRAEDAVKSCGKTFKAAKRTGLRFFQKLVDETVTDKMIEEAGYKRTLWREDIGVALFVATKSLKRPKPHPRFNGTVGLTYMMQAFKNLKEAGMSERGLDGKKWAAIKKVLVAAGLIVRIGGCSMGCSEKFALGPKHPFGKGGKEGLGDETERF